MAEQFSIQTSLSQSTKSARSLRQARQWIRNCCQHHKSCQGRDICNVLPTRLVQVSTNESGLSARICNGESLSSCTEYLTLSHCWGTQKFLTLTQGNEGQFRTSIPIGELTKSFQDALYATVELGFRYIWIDSLCIIQDFSEDWEKEAARMCGVYRNATCCLAGSASPNGAAGLFVTRTMDELIPPKVRIKISDANPSKTYAYIQDRSYWSRLFQGPLFERAWVLQEELLVSSLLQCELFECIDAV